jgi:hypothetical protein
MVRGLADLEIDALALMHRPAIVGDCRAALQRLAVEYDRRVAGGLAGSRATGDGTALVRCHCG